MNIGNWNIGLVKRSAYSKLKSEPTFDETRLKKISVSKGAKWVTKSNKRNLNKDKEKKKNKQNLEEATLVKIWILKYWSSQN